MWTYAINLHYIIELHMTTTTTSLQIRQSRAIYLDESDEEDENDQSDDCNDDLEDDEKNPSGNREFQFRYRPENPLLKDEVFKNIGTDNEDDCKLLVVDYIRCNSKLFSDTLLTDRETPDSMKLKVKNNDEMTIAEKIRAKRDRRDSIDESKSLDGDSIESHDFDFSPESPLHENMITNFSIEMNLKKIRRRNN